MGVSGRPLSISPHALSLIDTIQNLGKEPRRKSPCGLQQPLLDHNSLQQDVLPLAYSSNMRYPVARRASPRLCSLRFCSLRPLPRHPLHNDNHDSSFSFTTASFSTSASCHLFDRDDPKRRKKQQARKPTEARSSVTASASTKYGNAKRKEGSFLKAELGDIVETSGESELDFSEENLKLLPTLQLPTHQELSQLPGGSQDSSSEAFWQRRLSAVVEALDGELSMYRSRERLQNLGSREAFYNQGRPFFRTVINIEYPGASILIATGDSFSREGATRAATLHALAKIRARGLLTLPTLPVEQAFPDEGDGLIDVYNYAARYLCIPSIFVRQFKAFFTITIDMPEHDINVAIRNAPSIAHAEAAAAHEFKKQAELYHLSKGNEKVVVMDRHALSTRNAKDFFSFCVDLGETKGELGVVTIQDGELFVGRPQFGDVSLDPQSELKVRTSSRAHTNLAATLVAALSVIKVKPHLFDEFSKALHAGNGRYLAELGPKDVILNPDLIEELNRIPTLHSSNLLPPRHDRVAQSTADATEEPRLKHALTSEQFATKSSRLQKKLDDYRTRDDLESLRQGRRELPMSQYASQVRQIVHDNVYCVIIGATGSGKTTQVPQILLDEAIGNGNGASCNVICTQPRRIAATSVARRVALERAEQLQDTVGYHVRAEPRLPRPGGSILYCTSGILLQRLLHSPGDVLDHASHLVIDEVHERDIIIDFLLITLKNTMAARAAQGKKLPRVVLMSATVNAEQFAAYFRNSLPSEKPNDCPTLSVPGRTFPVQEYYLHDVLGQMKTKHGENRLGLLRTDKHTIKYLRAEGTGVEDTPPNARTSTESVIDWKEQAPMSRDENAVYTDNVDDALVPLGLAATTVAHITKTSESGAILVFLPGLNEIVEMDKLLRVRSPLGVSFDDPERFQIIMLHSSMRNTQKSAFDQVPEGCRKVILSTNIAETSVTIPDVRFVVDTGKSREKRYDQVRRITQLRTTWISKSNAKQRAGRAGRVQDGVYYALYTDSRRESMRAVALPELLRSDLQEICLDVRVQDLKMPIADFLAGAMDPPSPSAVEAAVQNLMSLGALTGEEDLTLLGRVLASLPVHPTLGKMILLGIIFGCLDPMIILGAAAHDRPLFLSPLNKQRAVDTIKRRFAGQSGSDHIMLLNAFSDARKTLSGSSAMAFGFFRDSFISRDAYKNIDLTAREILKVLEEAGLIKTSATPEPYLLYGGRRLNWNSGSEALIKALLVSGLYPNLAVPADSKVLRTSTERDTNIHPGSVNAGTKPGSNLFTFNTLSLSKDSKSMYMQETSSVTPLVALLFGGPLAQTDSVLEMDRWLPMSIRAPDTPGSTFGDALLADKVMNLRRIMDRMLASAFDDLASHTPLSEDKMRAQLAGMLARVLSRDRSTLGDLNRGGKKTQRKKNKKKKAGKSAKSVQPTGLSPEVSPGPVNGRRQAKRGKASRREVVPQGKASRGEPSRGEPPQTKARDRLDIWDRLGYQEARE